MMQSTGHGVFVLHILLSERYELHCAAEPSDVATIDRCLDCSPPGVHSAEHCDQRAHAAITQSRHSTALHLLSSASAGHTVPPLAVAVLTVRERVFDPLAQSALQPPHDNQYCATQSTGHGGGFGHAVEPVSSGHALPAPLVGTMIALDLRMCACMCAFLRTCVRACAYGKHARPRGLATNPAAERALRSPRRPSTNTTVGVADGLRHALCRVLQHRTLDTATAVRRCDGTRARACCSATR